MKFTYKCYEGHDSTDAELWCRTDQEVEIVSELGPDECDREEVGRMYEIRFADGFTGHAFSDELGD